MYFVDEKTRKSSHSTCYFEFQQGKYHGKCWLPDSVSIHMDDFDALGLYDLFSSVVPAFDYYGLTEITAPEWDEIISKAHSIGGEAEAALSEIEPWLRSALSKKQLITICGI